MTMKTYKSEKILGVADKIEKASCKATVACGPVDSKVVARKHLLDGEQDNILRNMPVDLMSIQGILVTTNRNRNYDFFSPEEVWKARISPRYKPANMNHQSSEMDEDQHNIGVIYDSYPVDAEYNYLDDDKKDEGFHILISMYLWETYFPEAVAKIKSGIDKNEMHISMECMFKDFGYCLEEPDTDTKHLVPRMEATAWLSAELPQYGGYGKTKIGEKQYTVSRWLKDIVFTGVGFVENPANPDSILFEDYVSHSRANLQYAEENSEFFDKIVQSSVFNINKGKISLWPSQAK